MIGILSVTRWNSSSVTDRQQLAATLRAQRYRRGRGGRKRPQVVLMSLIYYILEYLKRKSPDIVVQR